tara:strand:+ start:2033 stop:2461 length:429 start_codon:yes stop_codon:yes gene_type:complete
MHIKLRKTLGYLGAIPFLALSVIPIFSLFPESYIFRLLMSFYGGIILSFLGGMTWGWDLKDNSSLPLIFGIFISLVGFFIIAISNMFLIYSLYISLFSFVTFYFFELRTSKLMLDLEYRALRRNLTILVSFSYILTLLTIDI